MPAIAALTIQTLAANKLSMKAVRRVRRKRAKNPERRGSIVEESSGRIVLSTTTMMPCGPIDKGNLSIRVSRCAVLQQATLPSTQ